VNNPVRSQYYLIRKLQAAYLQVNYMIRIPQIDETHTFIYQESFLKLQWRLHLIIVKDVLGIFRRLLISRNRDQQTPPLQLILNHNLENNITTDVMPQLPQPQGLLASGLMKPANITSEKLQLLRPSQ
jgi:hypothetical protein